MGTDSERPHQNRLAQIYEFVDILGHRGQRLDGISFGIRSELQATGKDLGSLASLDLLEATWHSLRWSDAGLLVDWLEGPIMTQSCRFALEKRNSLLAHGPSDPEESEAFVWEDDNVEEGLRAFSRWLNKNRPGRCLLSVPTNGDTFFSAYCNTVAADLAVAQFERAGLSTSIIDGVDVPQLTALPVVDAVAEAAEREGFTPSDERVGRFHKKISERFSLVIQVDPSQRAIGIDLGAAHHEMNELGAKLLHDAKMVRTFPTAVLRSRTLTKDTSNLGGVLDDIAETARQLTEHDVEEQVNKLTKKSTIRRLFDQKWPKLADKELKTKEQMGKKAAQRNNEPFYVLQGEIAASIREFLDEHSIPYGDKR